AGDAAAADELTSLLGAFEASADFLRPIDIGRVAASLGIGTHADPTGRVIGAYRIERELGRGGMGIVFVASRADGQFDQRVALKLIKRGMDSDDVQRRFLTERQILAQLDHPNIARLLDGGITRDGQPWFAMEYVEGSGLIDYCNANALTVAQRLSLFLAICGAVQSAHNNLVVHRDLKPSNILVDPRGHPKLLDFGIAKLLDGDGAASETTCTAFRAHTPEFASPEQRRGGPITTASDVYQLGLLLYVLLTDRSPLAAADSGGRALTEPGTMPPRPSSVVVGSVKPSCRLPAKRLARRLAGDLDNIVLTALRQEPDRRYASAGQFAADIERHLDNLPVLARPDSLRYRVGKFLQRHTLGVAASALVVLALIAGMAGTAWQARVAATEAQRAAQIKAFALDLLSLSDPDAARGHSLTVRDMLVSGAERVNHELAGQPELQAEMLTVLGQVHGKLGDFSRAVEVLERGLELRREHGTDNALAIAQSLGALGALRYEMHEFADAEWLLRESLALHRQHAGDPTGKADVLSSLASVLRSEGQLEDAEAAIGESLRLREAHLGPSHPAVADALTELGVLARRREDVGAAMAFHKRALTLRRQAFGEQHYRVAESLKNLALVLHHDERFGEAERRYREALAIQESVLGESHPNVGVTLNSLASLLYAQQRLSEAKSLFERSLAINRSARGADDLGVARTLTNYGALLFDMGAPDASIAALHEALAIKKRTLAVDHPSTATTLNNLANILGDVGRADEAWPLVAEAAGIYERRLGADHPFRGIALMNQSRFELDAGRLAAAEEHALAAQRLLTVAKPPGDSLIALTKLRLGEVYLATDRVALARPLLEAAVAQFRSLDYTHKRLAESESALGEALSRLDEPEAALALLQASYAELIERGPRVRKLAQRRLDEHVRRYR
ncbi:MAG: serine/threonine-protein kinase, partial [Pseudomonadota bacterium]